MRCGTAAPGSSGSLTCGSLAHVARRLHQLCGGPARLATWQDLALSDPGRLQLACMWRVGVARCGTRPCGRLNVRRRLARVQELEDWVDSHPFSRVIPDLNAVIDEARTKHGIRGVGVVGFCWGGAVAQEVACTEILPRSGVANASCIVHGCYMRMHLNYARLKRSAAYFCGQDDGATPPEKRAMVERAFKKLPATEVMRMYLYPGQRHFFASRETDHYWPPAIDKNLLAAFSRPPV